MKPLTLSSFFSDTEMLERRIQRTQKALKGDKSLQAELDLLKRIIAVLEEGKSARTLDLTPDEEIFAKSLNMLSYKPIIYVANVSEEDLVSGEENHFVKEVRDLLKQKMRKLLRFVLRLNKKFQNLMMTIKWPF